MVLRMYFNNMVKLKSEEFHYSKIFIDNGVLFRAISGNLAVKIGKCL